MVVKENYIPIVFYFWKCRIFGMPFFKDSIVAMILKQLTTHKKTFYPIIFNTTVVFSI